MLRRSAVVVAAISLAAAMVSAPRPAAAEIYQWTDASGRLHFTHDLSQVPVSERAAAQARASAPRERDPIQTYSRPASAAPAPTRRSSRLGAREVFAIPVQKAGTSLLVEVRLNDRVTAPFYIDTGASDVVIPAAVARELGLADSGRSKVYQTANGFVTQRAVTLDSVALGDARVETVVASVSDQMQVGLLGLSYFNHFQYSVDPVGGVVRLVRNGLEEEGLIRGGRSEAQWRSEYRNLQRRIGLAHEDKSRTPESRSRAHARHDDVIRSLEEELELLEGEADDAKVPFSWRE